MPNNLSIAPLVFDTWPVARCDALPEGALPSVKCNVACQSVKTEGEFHWKPKRIASVKRKKSAEKQTRGLGPRERFTLPAKLSEYIRWECMPTWYKFYTIIGHGKQSIFQERNVLWLEAGNISHHSLDRSKKNQTGYTAAVVCQWIQAVSKFCWAHQSKLMLKRGVKLRSWCLLQSFFLATEMKIVL